MFAAMKRIATREDANSPKRSPPTVENDVGSWMESHYSAAPPAADNEDNQLRKWKGGKLQIFQIEQGFSFIYYILDDSHPMRVETNRLVGYRYDIETGEDGETKETRSIIIGDYEETRLSHKQTLPDRMVDVLRDLLQSYHCARLKLQSMVATLESLTKLETLLSGHKVAYLHTQNLTFDKITNEHRNRFVGLIRTSGAFILEMNGEQPTQQGLLNEQFLDDVAHANLERFYSDAEARSVYPHRFTPSNALLSSLCHLQVLELPAMQLKSECFLEFVKLAIDSIDDTLPFLDFVWRFTLDKPLTLEYIQQNVPEGFKFLYRGRDFYLFREHDAVAARFHQNTHIINDNGGLAYEIHVHFLTSEQVIDRITKQTKN